MIPTQAILFIVFLTLLSGGLLSAGFVTGDTKYIYICVGICSCIFLYYIIYCIYRTKRSIQEASLTMIQGMKKNKSDSNLELMAQV
jgi:hypothetical protein